MLFNRLRLLLDGLLVDWLLFDWWLWGLALAWRVLESKLTWHKFLTELVMEVNLRSSLSVEALLLHWQNGVDALLDWLNLCGNAAEWLDNFSDLFQIKETCSCH